MPRPSVDPVLLHARDEVRTLLAERLRAPDAAELRQHIASGAAAPHELLRDGVRAWVTDHLRSPFHARAVDGAYEHLLALCAHITPAPNPADWHVILEPSRASRRSKSGAFYTPAPLVDWLVSAALDPAIADARARRPGDPDAVLALRVCDPACGSGRFLTSAALRIAATLAHDRAAPKFASDAHQRAALIDVLRSCIYGVDIDDIAVMICRASLANLVDDPDSLRANLALHIREGDALLGASPRLVEADEPTRQNADARCRAFFKDPPRRPWFHWFLEFPDIFPTGFDAILGNPPFLNQLQSTTAVDAGVRALLRARFGGAVRGYADIAAAFLLLALELTRVDGRIGLVLPRSLLAVEHAGRVRAAALECAAPTALWLTPGAKARAVGGMGGMGGMGGADGNGFAGTNVATCAIALHKARTARVELHRAAGSDFAPLDPLSIDVPDLARRPSWSHLFADAEGIPQIIVRSSRMIADIADATADFRDQYYGLQGFIIDSPEDHPRRPKLITSGLIAPLESLWGRVPTRVHKRKWLHPRVDLDAIDAAAARGGADARMIAAWARARLVPKLLLATQTRVLEVLPDPDGDMLPCVPVITIVPKAGMQLAALADMLSLPAMTAIALTRHAGAGMSADAIKLSAKQVLALPAHVSSEGGEAAGHTSAADEWWRRCAKHALALLPGHNDARAVAQNGRLRVAGDLATS